MKLFRHGLAAFMSVQGKFHGNIWNNFTQAALHQPLRSYAQRIVGALQQSNAAPCHEATLRSQARGWESVWLGEPWRPNISKMISLRAKRIVVKTCFTLMLAKTWGNRRHLSVHRWHRTSALEMCCTSVLLLFIFIFWLKKTPMRSETCEWTGCGDRSGNSCIICRVEFCETPDQQRAS